MEILIDDRKEQEIDGLDRRKCTTGLEGTVVANKRHSVSEKEELRTSCTAELTQTNGESVLLPSSEYFRRFHHLPFTCLCVSEHVRSQLRRGSSSGIQTDEELRGVEGQKASVVLSPPHILVLSCCGCSKHSLQFR